MKPPHVSSVPSLIDMDPMAPFEFHYPADEPWWDEYDTCTDTSDYSSCDSLSICASSESDLEPHEDLNISFPSMFYHICDTASTNPEAIPTKEDKICRRSPHEKDVLIQKILFTVSRVAPSFVYKRRKAAKKRRKYRRRRKQMTAVMIEPELRMLWHNCSSVGDLFAPSAVSKPPPTPNLPTINLSQVNKQMLRRLPDVVYLPIHSCSPDPSFYERNVPIGVHDTLTSAFWKEKPFGALPAIRTNLGPVSPPTDACYGYVWTDDGWHVKAECSRVPDPGGGHQRGRGEEDRGGRVGGREARSGEKKCVRDKK